MTGTLPHMGSGGSPVDGDAGTDAADGGFEGRIDPEIRSVLERIPRMDLSDLDLARRERRALAEEARSRQQVPVGVQTEDERVPGLPGEPEVLVRVHRRIGEVDAAAPSPVLLWVHGGGHMLGEAAQDDPLLQALVSRTGCVCVAVDWRRSPEAPYPAAMDDCYAATAWVVRSAGRLGIDPAHVVAGGASSGGGLAAGLALLVRDRGEVQLAGQVLVYPMLDDRESIASRLRVDHPRLWSNASNRIGWASYLGALSGDDVPAYAAPSRASDMARLPPTWIGTGELDLFRDEDIEYASRLMAAGVPTELHVYPRAVHGFDLFAPHTAVSRRFCRDRDDALDRFLTPQNARP